MLTSRFTLCLTLTTLLMGAVACQENSLPTQHAIQTASSVDDFADLEAEYAPFTTQALTRVYLHRKLDHWIIQDNGEAMKRELAFACYKHPALIRSIFRLRGKALLNSAAQMSAVQQQALSDPAFDTCVNDTITPFYTNTITMDFVQLPGGSFQMGQVGVAEPVHPVELSSFYIQTTEVTQAQWQAIMGEGNWPGGRHPSEYYFEEGVGIGDDYPVYGVSWCHIMGESETGCEYSGAGIGFIPQLNAMDPNNTYRLPTEAEWEYAARAGTDTLYACPPESGLDGDSLDCLDAMGWHKGNANTQVHPVATKMANQWGLFDMSGNLREWTQDWLNHMGNQYSEAVGGSYPRVNPVGPTTGGPYFAKMQRGGAFANTTSNTRVSHRTNASLTSSNAGTGFRLVRVPR